MIDVLKVILVSALTTGLLSAEDSKDPLAKGKVSGELKSICAGYNQKANGETDTYATAIGGQLKYESADYNGFSAGVAFATSQDIGFATGDLNKSEHNNELSSTAGHYTELSEAYINYKYDGLNLRVGRQVVDTPLADSDEIRMIKNTFEAYVATYEISDFSFMAGNLQRWQGTDAGLDDGWIKSGEDGTWFGGVTYAGAIDFNLWYYYIARSTSAVYADASLKYTINDDMSVVGGVQYLHETEISSSNTAASIYGIMGEVAIYDLGLSFAYNKSKKIAGKASFSGFGGGTLYTSMDTMIVDVITEDRDVDAVVAGISYAVSDLNLLYSYGSFNGDANSLSVKAHVVEQDIGVEYSFDDNLSASAFYILSSDEGSSVKTTSDWDRIQINLMYIF